MKRVLLTLAAIAGFFSLLCTETAHATPIRPDLQKLLSEPQEAMQFVPARAGWQGPETSTASASEAAAAVLDQSSAARAMRAGLIAAAVPDPRLLFLIIAAIFLFRRLRKPRPAAVVSIREESPPAKAA